MEKEIFIKIEEIKNILIKKIKTLEDFNSSKNLLINSFEEIEKILKEIFNIKEESNLPLNIEPKENNFNNDQKILIEKKEENLKVNNENINEKENNNKEDIIKNDKITIEDKELEKEKQIEHNNIDKNISKEIDLKNENIINNNEMEQFETFQQKNEKNENNENINVEIQEEEENEKYSLPKLNFDYDKNINEILNDINLDPNKPSLKDSEIFSEYNNNNIIKDDYSNKKNNNNSINNDTIRNISKKKEENKLKKEESPIHYLIKNKNEEILKEINNEEANMINKIKISNLQKNGYSDLFSFNQDLNNINNKSSFTDELSSKKKKIINCNIINLNTNTNNTYQSEENIKNINNKQNMTTSLPSAIENENNIKNSKALRVADIIMKLNSNDILYDIITQLYSKDILNQLMSPNVDINLVNIIEQTIEKVTILENEEIEKLKNKDSTKNYNSSNSKDKIYNSNSDTYNNNIKQKQNFKNIHNYNNFNKLNAPKKNDQYNNNHRTSFSFYDKSNSSCYSQLPPKIPQNMQLNKYKAEYLNSEILQNYPKTGKTILGYEKFKQDKNRDFNFERSLRNDKYTDDYRKKRSYNFNNSKIDSNERNMSYQSNNRSFSSKKVIFNNYTSPFGDYFDSSLQKGGQSKLKMEYPKNNILFKNCRSPVKDYINGINDIYI